MGGFPRAPSVLSLAHVFLDGGRAPDGARIVSEAAVREMLNSRVPLPDPYMFGPEWALGLMVCDWGGQTSTRPTAAPSGRTHGCGSCPRRIWPSPC
ncbi:hypothetical protein Ntsu_44590 [Nocardia sp. IFM 10818]